MGRLHQRLDQIAGAPAIDRLILDSETRSGVSPNRPSEFFQPSFVSLAAWHVQSEPSWSRRATYRASCLRASPPLGGGTLSLRSSVNRPPERINPASAIERVHLACGRCVPSWEIWP